MFRYILFFSNIYYYLHNEIFNIYDKYIPLSLVALMIFSHDQLYSIIIDFEELATWESTEVAFFLGMWDLK